MDCRGLIGPVLALLTAIAGQHAVAAESGQDHPLVGRYEGSSIQVHRTRDFDEYLLPLGKFEDGGFADKRRLEGRITWIGYRNPRGRSTLEVFRNYQEQLAAEDFETLWNCESSDECGYWFADRVFDADPERFLHAADTGADEGIRYLAAHRDAADGEAWAQIVVYDDGTDVWTRVRVIEKKAREQDKIVVRADEMARRIDETGRVALYGIHFDTDSASIRAESQPTLEEIARLLTENPGLELLVVGHTDNRGKFDYNIDLSKRRAQSVTRELIESHGIERDRLTPWGVGFTSPVAANAEAAGRAKNRRVELVER